MCHSFEIFQTSNSFNFFLKNLVFCIIFRFLTHYIGKGKKALFVQLLYDEIAQSSYFTIEAQLLIREPLEIKIIIKKTILILIMHPTKDLVGCVIQYKISTFRQLNLLTQI